MEVNIDGEIMKVASCFKYLEGCVSKDGVPQEDVKMKVGNGLKTFGALKRRFIVKSVSLGVRRELFRKVV